MIELQGTERADSRTMWEKGATKTGENLKVRLEEGQPITQQKKEGAVNIERKKYLKERGLKGIKK